MSLAPYVRILARGQGRARSLTQDEAREAMSLMLSSGAEPEGEVVDWPLADVDLADADTCTLVRGDDLDELLDALAPATTLTRYRQDGVEYVLFVRPLVPGESTCDDVTVT